MRTCKICTVKNCDCLCTTCERARCVFEDEPLPRHHRLTRQERLEGLADRGVDTWEEYRGER